MTIAALFTLIAGIVVGYLGQRSRLCFVGGLRDLILVRDTTLLKGVLAFALTAWVAFPLASRLAERVELPLPAIGAADARTALAYAMPGGAAGPAGVAAPIEAGPHIPFAALLFVGGLGLGLCSILAGGCPLRQHVLAGSGRGNAVWYLVGFYTGALAFEAFVWPFLSQLVR
jgi:uncharacterized membrane protein YedE/YeeE